MTTINCERCGNKTSRFTRIKFADGYLCGKCRKALALDDTILLRSWAKKHSWKETKEFNEQQSELQTAIQELDKPRCPKCGSTNIQPLGQHKKGFSVGKAVGELY